VKGEGTFGRRRDERKVERGEKGTRAGSGLGRHNGTLPEKRGKEGRKLLKRKEKKRNRNNEKWLTRADSRGGEQVKGEGRFNKPKKKVQEKIRRREGRKKNRGGGNQKQDPKGGDYSG